MTDFQDRIAKLSPKQLALLAVQLQKKLEETKRTGVEPIAIVGIGCRFPGAANSPDAYWQLLCDGVDAITPVPNDRWQVDEFHDPDPAAAGKIVSSGGGFIEDVDQFDAAFFGITPREANSLDPRYRILLEVAWEALEHASIAPDTLVGSQTGIFVGACGSEYMQHAFEGPYSGFDAYTVSGSANSMAAGRIAYFLGTQGPAFTVDTACSSSLVAVHLACQSLRLGECNMALASGTSLILRPEVSIGLSRAEMLSPSSRCRTFDTQADGIVRGEGCGVVVLKRLSDAEANDDIVLAVIRGSAINQDGRSSGITAPSGPAQVSVIRDALRQSDLKPVDIDYIEAHGTGTSLGDPIEVRALGKVFSEDRPADNPIKIGSVKTNFGHLEASAGIAALIKVVLSLQGEKVPPLLHMTKPNSHIEWDELPIVLPTELLEWPAREKTRTAGVSSFGFSGTNAHVVVQEATSTKSVSNTASHRPVHLLTLSAKSEVSVLELAKHYVSDLAVGSERSVGDICFTASTGRAQLKHRIAVTGETSEQIIEGLEAVIRGQSHDGVCRGVLDAPDPPGVVFMFTGQGSQYVKMGRELYQTEPRFRQTIEHCDEILLPILNQSLVELLYPSGKDSNPDSNAIDQTRLTQPALFALEYALADLWRSWGVEPTVVIGHSLGEYVAACVAGVFSLEDGLRLIATRAQLMQDLPKGGAMAAVLASEAQVTDAIANYADSISIAAINGPANVVISGVEQSVVDVMEQLESVNIAAMRLQVSHAFHSALLDPMLDGLEEAASAISMKSPGLGIVSNTTGKLVQADAIVNTGYWREHSRGAVKFADSVTTLYDEGYRIFIEIGPAPTLLGMAREILTGDDISMLPSLYPGRGDWSVMHSSLASLYVKGIDVDWYEFHRGQGNRKVSLPTYPFERKRYWLETPKEYRRPITGSARAEWYDWLYEIKWRPQAVRRETGMPADFLQSPEEIAAGVKQYIAPLSVHHSLDVSVKFMPLLDALCTTYILRAFDQLGWKRTVGTRFDGGKLQSELGIQSQHTRLFERMLEILSEDGVVSRDGVEWEVVTRPLAADPEPIASDLAAKYPECNAELALTRNCGQSLAEVLTAEIDPMQLLFPGGSLELTEKLYQEAPPLRVQNALLEKAMNEALAQLSEGQKIRVLEIGAGTGSASSYILPALPKNRTEYVYTDLSNAFLSAAKQKFHDYPFISYQILDISDDPVSQGYEIHEFDLILAANVVHATPDLRQTLTNIRKLLAPEGLLIMLEATGKQRFGDLTVGLTPGWWSFTDTDLRPSYTLLSFAAWKQLFDEMGFTQAVDLIGDGATDNPVLVHSSVLVARGPMVEETKENTSENTEAELQTGDWLVLADNSGFGQRVGDHIRHCGGRCFIAVKAKKFADKGSGYYEFDPTQPENFGELLTAVQSDSDVQLKGVLHLLALDEDLAADSDIEHLRESQLRVCGSALYLVKALAAYGASEARIVIATQTAQSVGKEFESLNMSQTTLWGLARVIGLEHPELRHLLVDLDAQLTDSSVHGFFDAALKGDASVDQLAFRDGCRYLPRITPSHSVEVQNPPSVILDSQASYLVTGGLAGLGLLVAQWLVDCGARHLILLARSEPSATARDAIAVMEDTGAQLTTIQADVADYNQLTAAISSIDLQEHPLRGIIHSAGLLDDGVLLQQDWSRFQRVMNSKVDGSWNLHRLGEQHTLEFFVLFSSGASFTGSPGQGNHAAANAFMDALAHHRRANGLPGFSINWGPWSEIGAAVRTGVVSRTETQGLNTISPNQGLQILEHIFNSPIAQIAVLPLNPSELLENRPKAAQASFYEELGEVSEPSQQGRSELVVDTAPQLLPQLIAASPGRRSLLLLECLQSQAGQIMGLGKQGTIDPGRPLTDLGLDSLMAVELRNGIAKQVSKSLPATLLFNYPTLDGLVTYLLDDVLEDELQSKRRDVPALESVVVERKREVHDDDLDELSEDEMADLLAAELKDIDNNE